jgi:hypothetical protein
MRWFPVFTSGKQWVAKSKILIYIAKAILSKIVAKIIRKFSNIIAVHIEGPRHPLICLF